MNLIASTIQFPESSPWQFIFNFEWLSKLLFGLLQWVQSFVGEYWLAIILFTLIMRLITLPIDFTNKYFTKKNSLKMAAMKPEEDQLKKQFAGDPMSLNRARQDLYKRHNYSMGGFCLITAVNMIVMLMVFIGVFTALREVSDLNIYYQYTQLQETYVTYKDTDELDEKLKETYDNINVGFLWVKNIWRPDTWGSQVLTYQEFKSAADSLSNKKLPDSIPIVETPDEETYNAIYAPITAERQGWNGLLILILLAGATSYLSAVVNSKQMAKKAEEKKVPEAVVSYSMRKAKEQDDPTQMPQIDPAMMGNMMKFVMPVIMVIFTFSYTAALALYITVSSLLMTGFTFAMGIVVDKIIAKQDKAAKEQEPTVINPHAKYFKTKK